MKHLITLPTDLQLKRIYLKINYLAYVKVFNIDLWFVASLFIYDYICKTSSL